MGFPERELQQRKYDKHALQQSYCMRCNRRPGEQSVCIREPLPLPLILVTLRSAYRKFTDKQKVSAWITLLIKMAAYM